MYLAKQLTARSLPEIGRKFGGRDHTTVMHAVKKVDELRDLDASFSEDLELLRRMLEGYRLKMSVRVSSTGVHFRMKT
jgi:chromosomal replication initiator protein